MRPVLKRNILVALICALPAVLGVESATGHSGGGGSSSGTGSSGGTGSSRGHGGGNFPSGHSPTGLNSAHVMGRQVQDTEHARLFSPDDVLISRKNLCARRGRCDMKRQSDFSCPLAATDETHPFYARN
jgi:hypothetical protein